jgi:hypothetical protein
LAIQSPNGSIARIPDIVGRRSNCWGGAGQTDQSNRINRSTALMSLVRLLIGDAGVDSVRDFKHVAALDAVGGPGNRRAGPICLCAGLTTGWLILAICEHDVHKEFSAPVAAASNLEQVQCTSCPSLGNSNILNFKSFLDEPTDCAAERLRSFNISESSNW